MKHKHFDLIVKYYADMTQKLWFQANCQGDYELLDAGESHTFYEFNNYHIGENPPKRRITMAGIEFDAPEMVAPKVGDKYYLVDITADISANFIVWDGAPCELEWLKNGLVHINYDSYIQHSRALIALNKELCKQKD